MNTGLRLNHVGLRDLHLRGIKFTEQQLVKRGFQYSCHFGNGMVFKKDNMIHLFDFCKEDKGKLIWFSSYNEPKADNWNFANRTDNWRR